MHRDRTQEITVVLANPVLYVGNQVHNQFVLCVCGVCTSVNIL